MVKHTPGPWLQWAGTNIIIRLHSGADRSEDLRICEVSTNTWRDEGRYNAALIAAAPELLAELQRVYERSYNPFEPDNQSEQYKRVGALIAKATGEAA